MFDFTSPQIMGILNVTPDSFSDGGLYHSVDKAVRRAEQMVAEGAAIIDIGGESSRPGAKKISPQEELDRVIPVIEKIHAEINTCISIDTCKPEVMRAAIRAGAKMINDITALRSEGAAQIIKDENVFVCLMHMQNEPHTMQAGPQYKNVVTEIHDFLTERVQHCLQAGIPKEKIIIDPGFGFGKTTQHNLQLLNQLEKFHSIGCPLLVGWSRKASIGNILNQPEDQRLYGSLAAAVISIMKGTKILRVHDVKPSKEAIKMALAVLSS